MKPKRNQPEKELVVKPIIKKLKNYKDLYKDILWYQRLVAEDDIHCPAGTPDIVCIVDCLNGEIALLFIECKKPTKKEPKFNDLRCEQKAFFKRMKNRPKTLCVVINSPDQLWLAIEKARTL